MATNHKREEHAKNKSTKESAPKALNELKKGIKMGFFWKLVVKVFMDEKYLDNLGSVIKQFFFFSNIIIVFFFF